MSVYPASVQDLIDELGRLPGIGPRSAQRIAFHLLLGSDEESRRLADAVVKAKARVVWCKRCFNLAEAPEGTREAECEICADPHRDSKVVCVVEQPNHVVAMERSQVFRGRYHVLQGVISPMDGIYADQIRLKELIGRVTADGVTEVILATTKTHEGEGTALQIERELQAVGGVRVTKLASGLPVGGDLEYADAMTLGRALEGRTQTEAVPTSGY